MFEFFEGLIEKLGVELISDFSDKLIDFIKNVKKESKEENNDNGGDSAKIGSNGYSAKIGSSGNSAQIGSSGDYAQIGSSGDYAKIGSSGNSAQIGSSGDSAKIGSNGYSAQIGSSGYSAQIGSSGDYAKIGSSGYSAQIGSSGDTAKIGSSGYYAQIGSSGDYAKIGSSGNSAQIGSSGDAAQIGSSGNSAQIDISGYDSVGFACGWQSIIKAKKGTWISLCEYERNEEKGRWIPIFASSAQIGNKEYKDFKGRILKETEYYCLHNRKFYPVDISDGIKIIKISEKKRDNITIIKGNTLDNKEIYLVKDEEKGLNAHGETLKEALEDLTFKRLNNTDVKEIVAEIKKTNRVNKAQYRAITGACRIGTNQFCKQHNITEQEIGLDELRKILVNDYGAEKFWKLIDEED